MNLFILFSVVIVLGVLFLDGLHSYQCSIANNNQRLDCFPQFGSNEASCLSRGCCWALPQVMGDKSTDVPYCYYPLDYPTYQIVGKKQTARGQQVLLQRLRKTYLPGEIALLFVQVIYETNSRIRVKITDQSKKRFEVPIELGSADNQVPLNQEYECLIPNNGSFSLEIRRKLDGVSMFKTYGPLLYADQFIQISTLMSTDQIYGIGEQNRPFLHKLTDGWARLGLWARDNAIETDINLYGTHPFYMAMPANGKAFGTYFFNSNAQEFGLQPTPLITYRTIGGILDMFFFVGGTPEVTVSQYLDLIGKPMMPPFWSLGFHLSRYGYKNLNEISMVFLRNIAAAIPIGTQWADIDYMDKFKDFTVDEKNFSGLGQFIELIQQKYGSRFVLIIDPAISDQGAGSYEPYNDGLAMDIFVTDSRSKKPLQGIVWPGKTAFPDFTHPNITAYWTKQIQRFLTIAPVDGLWIDMNEPSSFADGSTTGCAANNSYDEPFFVPMIRDNSLIVKTICSSALHYGNVLHYNLHNLYGYTEAVATNNALQALKPNERPFILSRSTFSGSGKYTFHWTGDNFATWEQLGDSIRQILSFNMFGIPMVGADVCGFIGDSTEELCIRWMQLGAFYPFMRNHNTIGARDQDPASWSIAAQSIMGNSLYTRYVLLPHFYTSLVKSHLNGTTVFRPLSFEFYGDPVTHAIDLQFMIGSALLVTPVVTQGSTTVRGYFPAGVWYNLYSGAIVNKGNKGSWVTLAAPLDTINVALRGGQILTILGPGMTIDDLRQSNFSIICGMSMDNKAIGELYWDDGISIDSFTGDKFSHFVFTADSDGLYSRTLHLAYKTLPTIGNFYICGLSKPAVRQVTVNGLPVPFTFSADQRILFVHNLRVNLATGLSVKWS